MGEETFFFVHTHNAALALGKGRTGPRRGPLVPSEIAWPPVFPFSPSFFYGRPSPNSPLAAPFPRCLPPGGAFEYPAVGTRGRRPPFYLLACF